MDDMKPPVRPLPPGLAACAAALIHGASISGLWFSKTIGEMSGPYLATTLLWSFAWLAWPILAGFRKVRWACAWLSLLAMAPSLPAIFIGALVALGART